MKLGIFDLVEPPFGLGLFAGTIPATGLGHLPDAPATITSTLPSTIRGLLSALSVEELHMAYDDQAVVYYGKVQVGGDGLTENTPTYHAPSGNVLELSDVSFQFRITFPRNGSATLFADVTTLNNGLDAAGKADFGDLQTVLNLLGGTAAGTQSDFPTKNFRIELLFNTLVLHLPKDKFLPARLAADGWLERDPSFDDVTIHLPKIAMTITQNADNFNQTNVTFDGWGVNSMDDQSDLAAGELISMKPALCLHSSNCVGFGLEKIVLDLSADFTPPEIIEKNFGVSDDFKGLWMPQVRFFIAPSGLRGMAFDTWGNDILIDFDQGLSGEIGMELVNNTNRAPIDVDVVFYEGAVMKTPTKNGNDNEDASHNITRNSFIYTTTNAEIQLRIRGGKPPYAITIKRDGSAITPVPYGGDANRLRYPLGAAAAGNHNVSIHVEDSLIPTHRFWQENVLAMCITSAAATGNSSSQVQPAQLQQLTGAPSFVIQKANNQNDNNAVFITTQPDNATITSGGAIPREGNGTYRIPVQRNGIHVPVTATWATSGSPEHFVAFNPLGEIGSQLASPHGENVEYLQMIYEKPEETDNLDAIATGFFNNPSVKNPFQAFLARRNGRQIKIYGYASWENDPAHTQYNIDLSDRRAQVLKKLLVQIDPAVAASIMYAHATSGYNHTSPAEGAKGAEVAHANTPPSEAGDPDYHVAVAVYDTPLPPASPNTATAQVWRESDAPIPRTTPADPTPAPTEPERPSAFRRIGAKVRFQRNQLVYAEIFGEFDVIDEARRSGTFIQSSDAQNGSGTTGINNTTVSTPPGASAAASAPGGDIPENQGVIDFKISILYDTATRKLTQTLAIGFDRNNVKDGFVHLNKFTPAPLANTMASLLLFAPLIQGGVEAIQSAQTDAQRAQAIAIASAEIGVATLLGIFAIQMEKITLFDVEFTFSEISPDIWLWNAQQLTDIGVLLDYAVDFKVNFNLFNVLTIQTKDNDPATGKRLLPPRARYKAIGFNFHTDPVTRKVTYQPIFDTSKGYELSLGDPGALEVKVGGVSLNNLLRILSARLSKENPLTFEADLALNINLGIVSIDTVRVRLRIYTELDPVKVVPEIIPTKVGVNIPGALIGVGYLDFGNSGSSGAVPGASGGFQGYVDITVVPVKLRIAAAVGIKPIPPGPPDNREATAFFLGLQVELPAGIPLGSTGIGIFGFLGLFAMHYQRIEQAPVDGQLPPALKWFYETVHGNVIDIQGWQPKLDKWSFGVGVILGTMEGGFVLNLKGMFILELPGPRILILVKASILFPKPPDVKAAGNSQSVGILAVIDLDFNIGRLTIGMIIEYNIESVLALRIPVVSQFNFNKPEDWFLDIGNNQMPAEALILGIVRGYAYLMIHGNGIKNWPKVGQQKLYGFSLALGLGASLIFGDQSSGLYLEVRGDFAAGIGFSPLHFYGILELKGELHLWVVSISAWANLEVEGPDPHTWIHGKACGKVSCLFFDIEGCVEIEINSALDLKPPPDLLTSLTLVSRSSALMAGQGVDRPIDGALGKAAVKNVDVIDANLLTVPIDSIPVVNLFATPDVNGCTSFTDTIPASGTYTQDGWVSVSAKNFVHYRLKSITLSAPLLDKDKDGNTLPKPVNFWKKLTDNPSDDESSVDMALLCWTPDPTPRAMQRSKELTTTITTKWDTVCKPVAPATSVFFTFNQKPLGYGSQGWNLYGAAWPDPPGTIRSKQPDTEVYVFENRFPDDLPGMQEAWLALRKSVLDHAKVIGGNSGFNVQGTPVRIGRVLQLPFEAKVQTQQQAPNISEANKKTILEFDAENIIIDCGEIQAAELFLAMPAEVVKPTDITIRTLDKDFHVLADKKASDYGFTPIVVFTDLPDTWENAAGPWQPDATAVWTFLQTFNATKKVMTKILVHYKGVDNMRYIQIGVKKTKQFPDAPSLLLCAMEMLIAAEFEREEHDITTKESDKDALSDALLGDPIRALLKPGTQYEMTINYEYQRKNEKGLVDNNFVAAPAKTFVFKTDAKAPLRLDPWVFASTPQNDMRYHFKEDPVQVYFNDESVIQLFKAYNVNLEAKVLKANGNHPPVDPAKMKLEMKNPQVREVDAAIKTPFLHTLEETIGTTDLPCITDSGVKTKHIVFTIGVALLLNTEYSVEIIKEGDVVDPNSNTYRTPLYKLAFRTSRYKSASEFAAFISKAYSNTRLLKVNLEVLATETTDNKLEAALLTAGMPAMKAADNVSVSFLWSSILVGGVVTNKLEAILIDTPEPLWRKRPYPDVETVDSESGPMKHWVMKDKPEMELIEAAGSSVVSSIAHTQGGARTIIYLKPTAPGNQIHVQLKKHVFTHVMSEYNTAGHFDVFDVMNIKLPTVAPWAEED